MVNDIAGLAALLVKRDGISKNEAYNIIEDCQAEIDDVLSYGGSYDTVMDIIQDYLGLEPDYLDLFI